MGMGVGFPHRQFFLFSKLIIHKSPESGPESKVLAKLLARIFDEKCGEMFAGFRPFNFQEKWPQEISRKKPCTISSHDLETTGLQTLRMWYTYCTN